MHSVMSRRLAYAGATIGCSVALAGAIALAALVASADEAARRVEPRFPYVIDIDRDHRFFLYGEELLGPLRFEFAEGVLSVNARRLFPPPPALARAAPARSDSTLRAAFGGVPLVRACVADGGTWSGCVRAFTARQDSMIGRIGARWRDLGEGGGARADSALLLLDAEVVGEVAAARARSDISADGVLRFPVPGLPMDIVTIDIDSPFGATRAIPDSLTLAAAFARVTQCMRFLTHRRPAVYLVSRGGDAAATGGRAAEFLAEIDAVRADPEFQPKRLSGGQADEFRAIASR